jgi:acetoin utilization deacetylase AcuC-like enzyme
MLQACYSPRYFARTHTNSMEKLTSVANALSERGIAQLVEPEIIDPDILRQLHAPNFVDAFLTGKQPLASFQGFKWNEQLRDAILMVQGGQLLAADIAFKEGISANIAQGFHHAVYEYGGAYCTFNGLALIAQQHPNKRIFILDCDQHGGNGTAEFTRRLPNLFNFTIFGLSFGCPEYERSKLRWVPKDHGNFAQYCTALEDGFQQALDWKADLIVYQAGMDCHQADRFGSSWFDTESLFQRDKMVFEFAKRQQIPLFFVLAGGYQPLESLVELHVNTFVAAQQVYNLA